MQKSIYQDKTFATYWNERAGADGEAYKQYVVDPIMLPLVGELENKVVLDAGCGNGYLARKLLAQNPSQVILMDISKHNLEIAAENCKDPRVTFLEQDATERWDLPPNSVDLVYSNFMLNEVENIETPITETFRVLRPKGVFIFSVTHPSWALYIYAQEQAGVHSNKIRNLGNYFRRGSADFIMRGDTKSNPALKDKYNQEWEVMHYQRPLSDYYNQLVDAGFVVKRILEPELSAEILKHAPRFAEYSDHPVGLIFHCTKPAG
jgi:ubiquinone/menaquinone biosynthesis C-methylase UbiE